MSTQKLISYPDMENILHAVKDYVDNGDASSLEAVEAAAASALQSEKNAARSETNAGQALADLRDELEGAASSGTTTDLPAEVAARKLADTQLQDQVTDLDLKMNKYSVRGSKKYIALDFVQGGFLLDNGTVQSSGSSKVTGFIRVDRSNEYYLSNSTNGTYDSGVCYYSSDVESSFVGRQFYQDDIGSGNHTYINKRLDIPESANYIRIGSRAAQPSTVTLGVRYVESPASASTVCKLSDAVENHADIINALNHYVKDVPSTNVVNASNWDAQQAYINGSNTIVVDGDNALVGFFVKIDDCDNVNKTYIFKYFGDKSGDEMGLNTLYIALANEVEENGSVISNAGNAQLMRGYSINTDKSFAYLYVQFKKNADFRYENAIDTIQYLLDNIVVTKQEGSGISYPEEYIAHSNKKIDFPVVERTPADLIMDDSTSGYVALGLVDKEGNMIGKGVSFNVGQGGGGGELSADQLNVISSMTYHLQPSVLSSSSAILGAGWSGSMESGYTHVSGNTYPLEFSLTGMSLKARLLITFDVQGMSESNDVYISAGDSVLIKSYNGGSTVVAGLIYDGGNLKVTPTKNFSGTITNLKCRKLDDNGSETYTTVVDNVYCQSNSLVAGYWNVFIGGKSATASSLQDGTRNIAIGERALNSMTVGNRNVSIGTFSMPFVTEGENNIAIGSDSIYPVKKAMDCVSIGKGTMTGNSVDSCVAIGAGAMGQWDSTLTRTQCTVVGTDAATGVVNGNTHVGYRAGVNTKGEYNTSIGHNSLGIGTRTTIDIVGSNLTCVGHNASVANNDTAKAASNSTALGNGATITKSNQVVIGNSEIEEVIIGNKKIIFNADGSVKWVSV